MTKGLKLATPPRRRSEPQVERWEEGGHVSPPPLAAVQVASPPEKFDQVAATKVQFNKRIPREVADGYEILAIRTRPPDARMRSS